MKKDIEIPKLEDLEWIESFDSGVFQRSVWQIKGTHIWHHPTQPAIEWKNGDWTWFWMGERHKLDGPACCFCGFYSYYIDGNLLSKDEWDRHPQRIQWLKEKIKDL